MYDSLDIIKNIESIYGSNDAFSILKDFEIDVKDVYHVTTIEGLKKLAKLQGKRIDISGFTRGSKGVAKGLLNDAEILVKLEGKSSVNFENDVNTRTDRNGIRWLSPNGNVSKRLNARIFQFGQKIHPKIIKHFDNPSIIIVYLRINTYRFVYGRKFRP